MSITSHIKGWGARTRHAVWAFLFLTAYVISMVSPFVVVSTASALDTDWKTPTSTHTPNNWDVRTVANVQTDDNVYITENDDDEQGYSGYNFGLPANAIIQGIEAMARAFSSDDTGCRLGMRLSWNDGTSTTSSKYMGLTNTETELTFGGATDTWGHNWTVGQLSNTSFVSIIEDNDPSGGGCENNATTSVDILSIKVHYGLPASNPALTQACGLDIALVIDNSNSINGTEMQSMKDALKGFTSALASTPTQFSVTRFGTTASVIAEFSSNVTTTNTAIDSVTTGGGGTNWEDGLLKAYGTFDPRADKPNLVIFASDGNPTYHIGGVWQQHLAGRY